MASLSALFSGWSVRLTLKVASTPAQTALAFMVQLINTAFAVNEMHAQSGRTRRQLTQQRTRG